jgi:hypothetical protein
MYELGESCRRKVTKKEKKRKEKEKKRKKRKRKERTLDFQRSFHSRRVADTQKISFFKNLFFH